MDKNELLRSLCYLAITVILPVVGKALWDFLKEKAREVISKIEDQKTKTSASLAIDLVDRCVAYVAQTYVDSLKSSGEFTEEAAKIAFRKAKERAYSLMSDRVREYLEQTFGNVDLWLETEIEATVKDRK